MAYDVASLMKACIDKDATDLYITVGAPPTIRFASHIESYGDRRLVASDIQELIEALLSPEIIEEFNSTLEYNTAIDWQGKWRFRVNLYRQRQHTAMVMRRIRTEIPTLEALNLPKLYADLIMEKRGLVLVVGPTGSGKSTSLAAMLEHRNLHGSGHIVSIEDPIEFIHEHRGCIISQRDVGIDTYSFGIGLKNALRQSPDVIIIGEIRDKETMEHAIVFAETGHLCLATLHANNTNQAIERVVNFFPLDQHPQVLLNLSLNLKAVLSQRLVSNVQGGRSVAIEILLNQGLIRPLIHEGRIQEIRECIEKGRDAGMQTFDQALMDMHAQGLITLEAAMAESDSPANLLLAIKQQDMSKFGSSLRHAPPGFGLAGSQQF